MPSTDVQAQPPVVSLAAPQFAPKDLNPIRTSQGAMLTRTR
jgi:hypothetical protein